jgi:NAD(P)-dependent dehydrogenase (short-subunit alcohol dehydrogenase family)
MSASAELSSMSQVAQTVTVVTGAAGGVGSDICRNLSAKGGRLVLADVRPDALQNIADELADGAADILSVVTDIADPGAAAELAERTLAAFGRVDALVNNAGLDSPRGWAWEIDERSWRETVDVDLSGQWWCTKAFLPAMMAQRSGRVIFISSAAAKLGGTGWSPAYAAAKAGLLGLTTALAVQLEGHGVRVNAIVPGTLGSSGNPLTETEKEQYLAKYPLGFGGTAPVVHAVDYLLGPGGDWLSGAYLNVTGGRLRG